MNFLSIIKHNTTGAGGVVDVTLKNIYDNRKLIFNLIYVYVRILFRLSISFEKNLILQRLAISFLIEY